MRHKVIWIVDYESDSAHEYTAIIYARTRKIAAHRVIRMCTNGCTILSVVRTTHRQQQVLTALLRLFRSESAANHRIAKMVRQSEDENGLARPAIEVFNEIESELEDEDAAS